MRNLIEGREGKWDSLKIVPHSRHIRALGNKKLPNPQKCIAEGAMLFSDDPRPKEKLVAEEQLKGTCSYIIMLGRWG